MPAYFFTGGTAGAAALLAAGAELRGRAGLARAARRVAAGGALVSGPLLVSDLGRPERFLNMLRVAKPTSPMSIGSWTLAAFAPAAVGAAVLDTLGWLPTMRRLATATAAATGPVISTYTGVLLANTAIPAWVRTRRELPALFAASATAAAGAATSLLTPSSDARRLAVAGTVVELAVAASMRRSLGDAAVSATTGHAGHLRHASEASHVAGALVMTLGRRRCVHVAGAALILAGSLLERYAVMAMGVDSAGRPEQLDGWITG